MLFFLNWGVDCMSNLVAQTQIVHLIVCTLYFNKLFFKIEPGTLATRAVTAATAGMTKATPGKEALARWEEKTSQKPKR